MPHCRIVMPLCALCLLLCSASAGLANGEAAALRLAAAYPDAGMTLERANDGLYIRIMGERLLFEPAAGCPEPAPGQNADLPLCSSMRQKYPAGPGGRYPEKDADPGRTRNETLLKLLYGATDSRVRANCEHVSFLGTSLLVSSRHGVAAALSRVAARLEKLSAADPALLRYILPSSGAFSWRTIAGSKRLSTHSFGIAIDLNVATGPYWRWASASSPSVRKAKEHYPQAIVDAFEAEGFIWGGKWSHFDFMHYEYRPELLPR